MRGGVGNDWTNEKAGFLDLSISRGASEIPCLALAVIWVGHADDTSPPSPPPSPS